MSANFNFKLRQGDTFTHTVTYRDKATKTPIDLTGSTISGQFGDQSLLCTVTSASAGIFNFRLPLTYTPQTGLVKYFVRVTDSEGVVTTLLEGNVNVYS